jgi:hypothetical protein
VGTVQVRSLDEPDETRSFPNGVVEMVTIADTMIGRARFEPGWRWSNDVKPIAGTDWCMVLHEGYCVSGSAIVRADTGPRPGLGRATATSSSPVTMPGSSAMSRG